MTLEECIRRFENHSKCIQQTLISKEEAENVCDWLRELKKFKVLFVKANRDVGNVHLDNRAIFEKFFWEVWKILDVKGLEEVNADE